MSQAGASVALYTYVESSISDLPPSNIPVEESWIEERHFEKRQRSPSGSWKRPRSPSFWDPPVRPTTNPEGPRPVPTRGSFANLPSSSNSGSNHNSINDPFKTFQTESHKLSVDSRASDPWKHVQGQDEFGSQLQNSLEKLERETTGDLNETAYHTAPGLSPAQSRLTHYVRVHRFEQTRLSHEYSAYPEIMLDNGDPIFHTRLIRIDLWQLAKLKAQWISCREWNPMEQIFTVDKAVKKLNDEPSYLGTITSTNQAANVSQDQYPVSYFLYGELMHTGLLRHVLGVYQVDAVPATIRGGEIQTLEDQSVLVDGPDESKVTGISCLIHSFQQEHRLLTHMRSSFDVVKCVIEMNHGFDTIEAHGCTFRIAQHLRSEVEGDVLLESWKANKFDLQELEEYEKAIEMNERKGTEEFTPADLSLLPKALVIVLILVGLYLSWAMLK